MMTAKFLIICALCLILLDCLIEGASSKSKPSSSSGGSSSKKHSHGSKTKDKDKEEEEEEKKDEKFDCYNCTGANCTDATASECHMCFTLTSNSTVIKGCIEDESEDVKEDSCQDGILRDGVLGTMCYCKDKLCNDASTPLSSIGAFLFQAILLLLASRHFTF